MDKTENMLEHAKFMERERDLFNRLYYGFWIMFLGGFVLSLRIAPYRHIVVASFLVFAFRLLAVAGTILNFLMQYWAIVFLGAIRETLFYKTMGAEEPEKAAYAKVCKFEPLVHGSEVPLLIIALVYLLVGFAGSFLVHVP